MRKTADIHGRVALAIKKRLIREGGLGSYLDEDGQIRFDIPLFTRNYFIWLYFFSLTYCEKF